MAALRADRLTLTGSGEPVTVESVETTADLFRVLQVEMAQGRGFLPGEDQTGKNAVVVITDALWRGRFHGAEMIGKSIVLEGRPNRVVGILRPDFRFPSGGDLGVLAGLGKRTEIFQPVQEVLDGWDGDYDYICVGRLKAGTALDKGFAELQVLTQQMSTAHHVESQPYAECRPLQELIAGPVRTSLTALLAAVLALLLIVCLNLANLMMARASARAREFSIRTALGAVRQRLLRQVLTEAAVLFAGVGALGIAFAAIVIRLFATSSEIRIPRLPEVQLDGSVLLFSLVLTAGCLCVFGLLPAYRIAQSDPQEALRAGSHTVTANRRSMRLRELLVSFEVALSTILLFLAGLLTSSLFQLMQMDKGFTEERAIAVDLSLPDIPYETIADRNRFFDRMLSSVRAIPGVRSAGMISGLPLSGESHVNGVEVDGSTGDWIDPANRSNVLINVRFVSPADLETLGIPVIRGRGIGEGDRDRRVTVVSARMAAKIWGTENPIGKRFKTGSRVGQVEVIGVARDTYNSRLEDGPTLIAYIPYWLRGPNYGSLVMRTTADPGSFLQAIQRTIWAIDPALPVPPMRTMSEVVAESFAQRRFQMQLAAAFAVGALALALIGIYGVVAYNVAQRRSELGLRLALGAEARGLIGLVLLRGLQPALLGLGCGLGLSIALGRFVRSLLFGVTASDPLTIGMVIGVLVATAALACLLPAIPVARMDPASILRYE